ncbi:putative ABC transporter permease [Fulvivirga imtechensis AK7]|uniref:Putative ABC transporter permease n=1 Tax=Fulvivirga imtechensis AK7 TaxID=1237149 RepID=L8JJ70_9BACT|nr:ABC transporter permease [Fulvivirga imtechensis]ELR68951.1 putative ABC transporter permease [Fulvivirga imtechensis AK7]
MLKNYFKIAIRNLLKQFGYSFINIFGLAVGIACCLLLSLYILDEQSYDKFHKHADHIYRVNTVYNYGGTSGKIYNTPTALLPNTLREFSEVKTGTRLFDVSMFSPVVVQREDKLFQESDFLYADSSFFDVFSFQWVKGDPARALVTPYSVVLTEYVAKKYFGDEDPLGKLLKINNARDYQVTGVILDVPHNSHFHFDFIASFNSLAASKEEIWHSANYATYIVFDNPANRSKLEEGISKMALKQIGEEFTKAGNSLAFDLMPITDIHLYSDIPNEFEPQGDIKSIYIFGLIGILILIIACINYMNLATARSADRAREVGMRKVLGAYRKQLFYQFMGESFIITTASTVLAFIIVGSVLAPFNAFSGKFLSVDSLFSETIILGAVSTIVVVSLLAGGYPALSLSSYQPGTVLKGSFKRSSKGSILRKLLVVVQFSISIFLIIGTLVIYKQLGFMRDKELGYNKENVLIVPTDRQVNKNFAAIKSQLERRADVVGVSIGSENPANINGGYTIHVQGMESNQTQSVNAVTVDKDFVSNMGMQLMSGNNFTEADVERSTREKYEDREYGFIVNQQLLRETMLDPEEVVGLRARLNGREGKIVGVVSDFHFSSLKNKINPVVLLIEPEQYNEIFIRIKPHRLSETLTELSHEWKALVPHRPFDYRFLDQEYDALYKSEVKLGSIFTLFAGLAILIACLGLLGLVAFTVEQRTKEIGIRKVLGASIANLFLLISKDFTKLVIVAFFIAAPLGYYLMTRWLSAFEYKVTVGLVPVAVAVVIALFLSVVTISFQSVKAALMNPVDKLRNE